MHGQVISDFLYGAALLFNAALFIPQAIKIFKNNGKTDVSLITFGGFNVIQFLGFINGIYHDDYALIIGQAVSLVTCGLITAQLVYYKLVKLKNTNEEASGNNIS